MSNITTNQFKQLPVQGMVDLGFQGSVTTCQVVSTQVTALVPGQAVKMADVAGGVPVVASLAADTDDSFGVVTYQLKDATYPALSRLEVGMANTVIFMTAGAAIARGAKVEFVSASNKVITAAGTNPLFGFAIDKASADGDLIRVYILNPSVSPIVISDVAGLQAALDAKVTTTIVTATLAEINAGKILIAGVTGKKIRVTSVTQRVAGNFAVATGAIIRSTNGTPVVVVTTATAGLTTGAVLLTGDANNTLGAGFAADLGIDDGLRVIKSGSDFTGGTSVTYTITYSQA